MCLLKHLWRLPAPVMFSRIWLSIQGMDLALPWFWCLNCQPWSSLTKQISAETPSQRLIHFVSISIPLLSGYSSWPFISIIDRSGGIKKKKNPNHKIKTPIVPRRNAADHISTAWVTTLSTSTSQQKPGIGKSAGQMRALGQTRALGQPSSAPFPQGCLCLCPATHKHTEPGSTYTPWACLIAYTHRETFSSFFSPDFRARRVGTGNALARAPLSSLSTGGGPHWYCTHLGVRGTVTHPFPPHQAGRWAAVMWYSFSNQKQSLLILTGIKDKCSPK